LPLCLTKYHAIKIYHVLNEALRHEDVWGVDVDLYAFLTPALDGGELSASRSGRFTPEK